MSGLPLSLRLTALLDAFIDVVEPVVAALSPGARWIAVETAQDALSFYRNTRRGPILVGRVDGDGAVPEPLRSALRTKAGRVAELRLLADRFVAAQMKVPREASGFAGDIVASRLDRLTPWRPDKVLYGFAVERTSGPEGQVTVNVIATSRDIVAAAMARLAALDVLACRVGSAAQPLDEPLRIDLLRGESDKGGKRRRRRIGTASLALLALSVLTFLGSQLALSLSTGEVAETEAALTVARSRMVGAADGGAEREREAAMLAAKTPSRSVFMLIDRIATILPDTTYLDELDILPGSLRLAGTSTEASALVGLLESEPSLSEARFAAPVTRQEDGRDRFDISVVRRTGDEAPQP